MGKCQLVHRRVDARAVAWPATFVGEVGQRSLGPLPNLVHVPFDRPVRGDERSHLGRRRTWRGKTLEVTTDEAATGKDPWPDHRAGVHVVVLVPAVKGFLAARVRVRHGDESAAQRDGSRFGSGQIQI